MVSTDVLFIDYRGAVITLRNPEPAIKSNQAKLFFHSCFFIRGLGVNPAWQQWDMLQEKAIAVLPARERSERCLSQHLGSSEILVLLSSFLRVLVHNFLHQRLDSPAEQGQFTLNGLCSHTFFCALFYVLDNLLNCRLHLCKHFSLTKLLLLIFTQVHMTRGGCSPEPISSEVSMLHRGEFISQSVIFF